MFPKQSPSPSPPISREFNSPLPGPSLNRSERKNATATFKRSKFLRRLVYFRHMDFEFALWQMLYLFISPQKVYRNFQYRKLSSVGFAFVLHLHFLSFLKFLLWVVFIDCIGIGLLVATILWFFSNHYLRKPTCQELDVEWGYAFDVHLNAFFPLLIILHFFQLFFYHVLIRHDWFISRLFGNTLWFIAIGYYIYITFLGYSALPILKKTRFFLYPLTITFFLYLLTIICGWNLCHLLVNFYHYRVM
ncbi:unc50 RNA binding protein isoform X2 [Tachypleus tridentatus]|uniref:unc50 RNA binding protein isoform X2 n=1 Tax=Tachypleus tridentatus TaxID=6853 RepID=UPI003FD14618